MMKKIAILALTTAAFISCQQQQVIPPHVEPVAPVVPVKK